MPRNSRRAQRRYRGVMTPIRLLALAVAAALLPSIAFAQAAKVRVVHASGPPVAPKKKLHTEFNVAVNAKGQVVLVKSGKSSPDDMYNAQTYGNVLQMWIRHPDGSARAGMYRVSYDYDPKTKAIHRAVKLLYPDGRWANSQGAANQMMDVVRREYEQYRARQQQQERAQRRQAEAATKLPSLKQITKPTSSPHP